MTKPFQAEQFTATKWASAEEKAQWANKMAAWILRGFPATGWTKTLYKPLSNMFGHIAHYNQYGFFSTWFEDVASQARWLSFVQQGGTYRAIYGDPTCTWSDVEHAMQDWVTEKGLVETYNKQAAQTIERAERAQLARLQAKYSQE